jgi:transposase
MASNPVSAGGLAADSRASVIIWLTNGASIKADEAWERKEGIWYRQAGMVTFLKRSRVRAIQRLAAPNPRLKSTAINAEEKNRKPENATAQNQPRVGKPETASAKKESRVGSFLKKAGRILKKPFKF